MDSRIDKNELYKIVEKNRSEHNRIFLDAVKGYRKAAVQQLEDHIKRIKSGSLIEVFVRMPRPIDHTSDYDRVLKMIEMSEDDTITLHEHEFGNFVMDDWDWKGQFLTTNREYSSLASAALATSK